MCCSSQQVNHLTEGIVLVPAEYLSSERLLADVETWQINEVHFPSGSVLNLRWWKREIGAVTEKCEIRQWGSRVYLVLHMQ